MKSFRKTTKRNAPGFTLIELLVVIAIIAILAAILFPVFASAREKSRQAADSSNLRQIGLAFLQYQQDFDEYFPFSVTERYSPQSDYTVDGGSLNSCTSPTYVGDATVAADYSIRGLLNPYVKSAGVWHDPSQTVNWAWDGPAIPPSASDTATNDGLSSKKAWFLTDYGFNFDESVWAAGTSGADGYGNTGTAQAASACVPHAVDFQVGGQFYGDGFNGTYNLSKISSPATFILGTDTIRSGQSVSRGSVTPQPAVQADGKTAVTWEPVSVTLDATQASIELRHSGGANFLFDDAHVKWLTPDKTWTSQVNYWARQQN
ncbi:MAG: prepilin-type N-terminal cleavage/methylation domain-containing protein [Capsulimonadaceae bacterium]|nr:prepilin-type N-terminal cleavage/methylation domain-containing protein [Capsulimonadaceae bacterium]